MTPNVRSNINYYKFLFVAACSTHHRDSTAARPSARCQAPRPRSAQAPRVAAALLTTPQAWHSDNHRAPRDRPSPSRAVCAVFRDSVRPEAEIDILTNRHVRPEREVLKDHSDAAISWLAEVFH